jgi:hypothetical protein
LLMTKDSQPMKIRIHLSNPPLKMLKNNPNLHKSSLHLHTLINMQVNHPYLNPEIMKLHLPA